MFLRIWLDMNNHPLSNILCKQLFKDIFVYYICIVFVLLVLRARFHLDLRYLIRTTVY